MRRLAGKSKKSFTLVELIVAMALTAMFAGACVMFIMPITKMYTHMNDLARAQLLADTVADCLRAECTGNHITQHEDVWIASKGDLIYSGDPTISSLPEGKVLVIRKTSEYCETIASNYAIDLNLYNKVKEREANGDDSSHVQETGSGGLTSRAIYRMFSSADPGSSDPSPVGFVHFGYFEAEMNSSHYVFPKNYYDFTDPLLHPVYGKFTVELKFSGLKYDSSGVPAYVLCDIGIVQTGNGTVYTRQIALPFS